MDPALRGFVRMYLFVVGFFLALGLLLAAILHLEFLSVLMQVYFWVGIGYLAASALAWTGFANLYRYSPTLFVGLPSYRRQIIKGQIWKEGRDNEAFLIGICFSLAILALAAALIDPILVLVDILGLAVALLARHALRGRMSAHS